MPLDPKVQKIYTTLKSGGADVGTEQEFNSYFFAQGKKGYENRKKVYDTLTGGGADAGKNYEEFRDWLGLKAVTPQRKQQASAMIGGKATPAQQAQPAQNNMTNWANMDVDMRSEWEKSRDAKSAPSTPVSAHTGNGEAPAKGKPLTQVEAYDKAMKGDLRTEEAQKAAKSMQSYGQKLKEEIDYKNATGEDLRLPVNLPGVAPTAVEKDGQMLMGITNDEDRVAQYEKSERDIERKKIVDNIVDDMQSKLEGAAKKSLENGIRWSAADPYMATLTQNENLKNALRADSPEELKRQLEGYFGLDKGDNQFEQFLVDHQGEIQQAAQRLGKSVEDFTWNDLIPNLANDMAERINKNMSEKYSVKDTLDWIAKRMVNSSVGALARMGTMTPGQSQMIAQEVQKSREGEGSHFNASWLDKATGEVAQFLPDAPLMAIGGILGGAATKAVGAGVKALGGTALGSLIESGSPMLAANVGKAVKYSGLLGNRILGSAANMASFMGMSNMLQTAASMDSTEDGYWSSIGLAGLEGAEEGAKMGTALGVLGLGGQKLMGLSDSAAGRAAIASGAFLAENQIFALSDYLENPEKFSWVDSSLDALYMMMAGRVAGMTTHGTEGMKHSFRSILYGDPMPKMPRLTDDEKAMIQKSFGGMSFEEIASDMNNLGKILSDKQNIPLNVRQKLSGAVMGVFEPNRPHTYMTSFRGKEIQERAKDGELLAVHKFNTNDERDQIMQEIAERKANDEMISYYNILNARDQEALIDVLDKFSSEYEMSVEEIKDIMSKRPIERVQDEQDLMDELSMRLHDAAFPDGKLHTQQSAVDGANIAGDEPVVDPEVSASLSGEVKTAMDEYNQFMKDNKDVLEGIDSLGEARPDEVILYVAMNFSGEKRDEGIRVISNYFNALAKKDAYKQKIGENINESAETEADMRSFKGTIDGSERDNIITVTDGTNQYTLVNGDVATVETGGFGRVIDKENSGDMIILLDMDGQFVPMKPDSRLSVIEETSKEDFASQVRERLGVENTATLVETGLVEPPSEKTEQKTEEQGEQADVEAGGNNTGADEASATPTATEETVEEVVQPERVEIPEDKDGTKRYEQANVDFDTAIKDMQDEGLDVGEMADAYINEAKEKLDKLKPKKGEKPGQIRKRVQDQILTKQTIEYYENLKKRYNDQLAAEKSLNNPVENNNEPSKTVTLQPKVATQPKTIDVDKVREEAKTPEGRKALLDRKKNDLDTRWKMAKIIYGDLFNDDSSVAETIEEIISMNLLKGRTLDPETFGDELGWDMRVGRDAAKVSTMFDKKKENGGNGTTFNQVVHDIWESPENTVDGEKRFSTEDIRNALIAMFQEARDKWDITERALTDRIERAEKLLNEEIEREKDSEVLEDKPVVLTDEDIERINKELPFEMTTDEEIPEAPANGLKKTAVELMDEGSPNIEVVDTDRISNESWKEMLNDEFDMFLSDEEVEQLVNERIEEAVYYNPETGKITVFSGRITPDELRERVQTIKDYINDRNSNEGRESAEGTLVEGGERGVRAEAESETAESGSGEGSTEPRGEVGTEDAEFKKGYEDRKKERESGGLAFQDKYDSLPDEGIQRSIEERKTLLAKDWREFVDSNRVTPRELGAAKADWEAELEGLLKEQERRAKIPPELRPRNGKERRIISDVEKKLAEDIKEAEEEVRKAKSALEKAQVKESDKATDMFSDDNAFKEKDQLFDSSEMPTDRSKEGVDRRTEAERERLLEAEAKLENLKSEAERNSRVRGALDNERRQTEIGDNPTEAIEKAAKQFKEEKAKEIETKSHEGLLLEKEMLEERADGLEALLKDKPNHEGARHEYDYIKQRLEEIDKSLNAGKVKVEKKENGETTYTTKQGNKAFEVSDYNKNKLLVEYENLISTGEESQSASAELMTELNKLGEWGEHRTNPRTGEKYVYGWLIPKDKANELDRVLREHLDKLPEKGGKRYSPGDNPTEAIEQAADEFRKEQDAKLGITHNETPQEVADSERAKKLVDTPLSADEIDNSDVSEQLKTLAKAYVNGNHGVLQEAAYLNTYDHVRNRRQDNEADRGNADRTQLAGTEDSGKRGLGRTGGQPLEMAETESERSDEGQEQRPQPRLEDGEGRLHTATGERSDSRVPESEPELDGVSTRSERPGGRSVHSEPRPELGEGRADKGSGRDTGKLAAGSDAAIEASKQRLRELREKFKKAGRGGDMSISLVGMNSEQIETLGEIITESANLGYQYLAKGINEFKDWKAQMLDDFKEWLREDMKWSDPEIDEYINEVWNCEYNIDGVTRTIGEWASYMGEQKLRKVVREDLQTKYEKQKAAESIEVKTGDIDNIRETLPYLLPEQQDDVLKTETQFFDPSHQDREHGNGKGMMFTNGTGTGKTYTGLGIVKRFVKQGKGRVLILTPSQEKVGDWKIDGMNLGLDIEDLESAAKAKGTTATKAKGKGVVITTYANARQNLALLEDCFDLVVYDESHKITEGKEAAEGEMFKFHQMLTNKDVEKSIDRQTYYLPEWIEYRNLTKEIDETMKQIKELEKIPDMTPEQQDLLQKLNARIPEIYKRLDELRPIMHEIRETKREQAEIDSKVTKTVFLSATPFNTRENLKYAEGYLFSYPKEDESTKGTYNHRSPQDAFLEQYFPAGYRWRYGRLESHVENAEALGRQEIDFSDYLQNTLGTLSGRMITSEWDYSRDFPIMTLDHAGRFNQAMSEVYRDKRFRPLSDIFRKAFDYNYSTALFEAMKTSLVIDRIKEHLKRGQKVVVFHRRRTSGDLEPPFERALDMARVAASAEKDPAKKQELNNAIDAFRKEFADMLEWEQGLDYTLPRDQIAKVFGEKNIGFFSGAETKGTKHKSVEEFMKDNGGKDIIVIQEASGKEGISLHDKTGEHQRVEINLALPQSPIAFIQIEGRIYRIGQKSNAIFEYPLLGLDLETSLFAQRFNAALGTTENLALGSKARNLRQSIANAVLENAGEIDYDRQGFGGKDMDGQVESRGTKDGFDNAISDYYGNHKMRKNRGDREGFEYYPTPEPVGWKMVQWAQLMENESALEPSAGHGAIARYVPESNPLTAIEPSAELFSKLQMRAGGPGRKFEEKNFEEYPLVNKHDAIVMNPPYGVQGKMAMEHVAKAFKHLNEGGRLIALIPDGPAMEKRLDAWLDSKGMDGLNGSAVVVGEVRLPDVAFERAGTRVRTKVVVIDKVSRPKMREGMPDKVSVDLTNASSVDELFDRLRNVNMPERTIDQAAIAQKRALKTKKALEDNKFVRSVVIDEDGIFVSNRSRYAIPELRLYFSTLESEDTRRSLVNLYGRLNEASKNADTADYGKWVGKAFGSGKNAVRATDAIRDYCDTAKKTIANILKTTEDALDRELKTMKEEEERRKREENERFERMREQRRLEDEQRRQGLTQKMNDAIETMHTELADDPRMRWFEEQMEDAHMGSFMTQASARRRLREAGIDWETGKKIINKKDVLEKAYDERWPLDLETMKQLMDIAETSIDGERKMAAKRALEMSGIHSDTGEAKESYDPSAHDEYYEKDLREFLKKAEGFGGKLETKQQIKESGRTIPQQPAKKEAFEYKLDKNTKTGDDMHLVFMNNRVDDATYKELQRKAKALNDGYFNRFKKAWHFKTEEDARKFIENTKDVTRFREEVKPKKTPKTLFRFAENEDEFDRIRKEAIDKNGIVVSGLGEKEVNVVKVPRHDFTGTGKEALAKAKEWAKKNLVGEHKGTDSASKEFTYHIDNDAIGKFLSQSSTGNSDNLGVHLAVLKELPDVIGNSIEAEVHPDYIKDTEKGRSRESKIGEDALVHRFYGAVEIEGKVYRVKTTILETKGDDKSKPHDYKVTKVDVILDGGSSTSNAPRTSTIAGAKLLKDVEKSYDSGKKILEESQNSTFFKENNTSSQPEHVQKIAKAIEKTAKKLNQKVNVITSPDEVKNPDARKALQEGRRITGWYNAETGEVDIYLPNVADRYAAEKTIAHEIVGHKGMRELLGEENYKAYMRSLWLDLHDENLSKYIRENSARHGFDFYRIVDEYLAEAAEKGYGKLPFWMKVRDAMTDALRKAGFEMTPSISDAKYMLWLSKNNLEDEYSEEWKEEIINRLEDERYEAKIDNGEFGFDDHVYDEYSPYGGKDVPYFPGQKTYFRSTPSAKTAKQMYEKELNRMAYAWKEGHVDAMQSAIELMRAISGVKKIEDIPSVENFVLAENQISSKEEQMDYQFYKEKFLPLDKAVAEILPDMGKNVDDALRNLQLYMIKKSGLERNRVLYVRDKIREYRKDPDMDQDAVDRLVSDYDTMMEGIRDDIRKGDITLREYLEEIDTFIKNEIDPAFDPSEHDYSGITSMYGKDYNEGDVIDDVMSTEDMIGERRTSELWNRVKDVTQYGLDLEYEGGLDSKEKHDRVSKMFEWYVPMRGTDEKTAEDVYDYLEENKKGKWIGPVIMNAKGHEHLSDVDVFAQMGAMASSAIGRSLRNQMKQSFARFVRNHYKKDGDDRLVTELKYLWGEKVAVDPKTGKDVWEEVFPDIPENATADEVAQIVKDFEDDMKAKEGQGLAKKIRQNSTIPFRPSTKNKPQHMVEVYINGDKKTFIVNGNPRAAQAINGKLKGERGSNILWLSDLSHFMAKLNTSYSPDFIARNTERDFVYAAANVAIKENADYWKTWAKNYMKAVGRVGMGVPTQHTNLFKRYREGNLDMSNPTDKYFKEFMDNGGETGWVEQKNLDKWKKIVKEGLKDQTRSSAVKFGEKVIDAIPDLIEAANERAENMARFATYMTSREKGRSITRSVSDAKEITVNFNRKGSGKKASGLGKNKSWIERKNAALAGWSAQNLQDYVMFYNAGVQGMNNMIKNVAQHPVKGGATFAAFAAAAMLMPWLNQQLFEMDDDKDKDVPENPYAELPEWVRRNNLCIYTNNGNFVTIALPIELRAMYGIGDIAASFINHPELRSTKNAGVDILTQLNQVTPLDFMGEGAGPGWALVPSGIRPIAEAAANVNWLGQPIERENYGNDNKPTWTRAFKNVGDVYVGASKKLNAATNPYDDENIKGWADGVLTDPSKVQHIVEGYLGGAGATVNRLSQLVSHGLIKKDMTPKELVESNYMPIVRTQHYSPNERTRYARTRNKWFYYRDEMKKTEEVMKALRKRGYNDPIARMQDISESEGARGKRAALMKEAEKAYNKIQKTLNATNDLQVKNWCQMELDQLMETVVNQLEEIK